eukprot:3261318-Pyramimonas_sp.AAC.1
MASACADDIGCVLAHLRDMQGILPDTEAALSFAGLLLQPRKCVLVPLWTNCFEDVDNTMRDTLREINPAWA